MTRQSTPIIVCAILALLAHGEATFAQAKVKNDWMTRRKEVVQRQMTLVIDDLKRICKLSPEQDKKLKLAAKGAVSASLRKYEAAVTKVKAKVAFPNAEAMKDMGEDDFQDILMTASEAAMDFAYDPKNKISKVSQEARWKKSLKTALSKEQLKKYEEAVAARKAFHRFAAVANFIARVDRKLVLSPSQRESLTKIVNEKYGEILSRLAADEESDGLWFEVQGVDRAAIPYTQLKFFSAGQMKEWKRSCESALAMANDMQSEVAVFPIDELMRDVMPPRVWGQLGLGMQMQMGLEVLPQAAEAKPAKDAPEKDKEQ